MRSPSRQITTTMAATCEWKVCGEEENEESAIIVKFSNGLVKSPEQLDFRHFRHIDKDNPRKKSRRIVVAESDRLAYVGNNFGSGSLQCNNLCSYFVGVLDKTTMEMKVQKANLFNLQPRIPGETVENANNDETKSYRDKVDTLIEAFGTTKQKRALSSRRLNEVGNETLQKAVARAAGTIIDQKGLEALQQEVAESEAQTEIAYFLPPCNKNADKREDVYPFDSLLSKNELESLKFVGDKMAALSSEDLQNMKKEDCPETVLRLIQHLPKTPELQSRQACCAWYLHILIKIAQQRRLNRKLGEDSCPQIIFNKLLKNFTVESFANGRLKNTVSVSMQVKIASHCLALLLHLEDQTANLTLLQRDLNISENKMLEVAKAMGLTISRQPTANLEESGVQDEHKMVSLELPLVRYERRIDGRKRKKMK